MVGRQTPFLALLIPFVLVFIADGRKGLKEAWPAALTAGVTFAIVQFAVSNYFSIQLTDILASLASAGAVLALVQVWHPFAPGAPATGVGRRPAIAGAAVADAGLEQKVVARQRRKRAEAGPPPRWRELLMAFAPYIIIVLTLGITSIAVVTKQLDKLTTAFSWPGLHVVNAKGKAPTSELFKLNWMTAAGTWLFISGVLTALVLRVRPGVAVRSYLRTLNQLKWAIVTVAAVLGVAYVMNLSGQTATLGTWAARAGGAFAFLSPLIGWFGTAVTGSDTSTNSLFGALQVTAAHKASLSPILMAGANSSGGVLAKMVSPQNLAIGAAAVGLAGREGDIFRRVIGWSLVLILLMAVLVLLQSGLLSWMVP
jgi:lactate permease